MHPATNAVINDSIGSDSVITSLWKADDESTAYIAHSIHRYLQKGLPVDKALQQSKKGLFE